MCAAADVQPAGVHRTQTAQRYLVAGRDTAVPAALHQATGHMRSNTWAAQGGGLTAASAQVLHQPGCHAHNELKRGVEQRVAACAMQGNGVSLPGLNRFRGSWTGSPCAPAACMEMPHPKQH